MGDKALNLRELNGKKVTLRYFEDSSYYVLIAFEEESGTRYVIRDGWKETRFTDPKSKREPQPINNTEEKFQYQRGGIIE